MNVLDTLAAEVVSYTSQRPWDDAAKWKLKALYFSANGDDPRFEAEHELVAQKCESLGIAFCLWLNVPRTEMFTGAEVVVGTDWARRCSAQVNHYGGAARVQAVMFDNEKVPLGFQEAYMREWDRIRPFRPTLYSVEPGQDESQNRYTAMLARNLVTPRSRKVTFQCYQGGMQPLDPSAVRNSKYGPANVADDDLCPTVDPAQPREYIASASACGLRGLMLFETGRM